MVYLIWISWGRCKRASHSCFELCVVELVFALLIVGEASRRIYRRWLSSGVAYNCSGLRLSGLGRCSPVLGKVLM